MNELISKSDKELLSSILRKDNERILGEMENAIEDILFSVAYEGGRFRITRFRCPNSKTYFRHSGGGMTHDENDDEKWEHYEDAPTASFEGAIAELSIGKDLLALKPSVVHQDVRDQVRKHIKKLLSEVTEEDRLRMRDYLPRDTDEWFNRIRSRD